MSRGWVRWPGRNCHGGGGATGEDRAPSLHPARCNGHINAHCCVQFAYHSEHSGPATAAQQRTVLALTWSLKRRQHVNGMDEARGF
jgi:hypothetical protein